MYRLLIVLCLFLLTACDASPAALLATPTPDCRAQAQQYTKQLDAVAKEWDDANKLAGQTPRASLATQIGALQAIRRKAEALEPLDCTKELHAALLRMMNATIDGYIAFLGQKPDSDVQAKFTEANKEMDTYSKELIALSVGLTPTAAP